MQIPSDRSVGFTVTAGNCIHTCEDTFEVLNLYKKAGSLAHQRDRLFRPQIIASTSARKGPTLRIGSKILQRW
ncbi:hypothetical protein PISMIDRAFT_407071 [Pisolithus microcarpus 441]|uniref:Uncharacterized protein n=1 Tax=Pisolithus microcarpus 441 TaxID=765257 RepID=A0A0C9XLS3_9AGAM|nr:hypothetical protein PISMIDRAFT_407071 [Pisolithus microcarpus 441]